jgi:hypothetical protein
MRMACSQAFDPLRLSTMKSGSLVLLPPFLCVRTFQTFAVRMSDVSVHSRAYRMPDESTISLPQDLTDKMQQSYVSCRRKMPAVIKSYLEQQRSHSSSEMILLVDDSQRLDEVEIDLLEVFALAASQGSHVRIGRPLFNLDEITRTHIGCHQPCACSPDRSR